ncbi:uncharacterized protein LOC120271934 [Dioscorea cayenensis subsp. rotundata]|uniref:Uncharacterized protein LOC120271934 n=1 Tax=Dioscorea cayennensis subsp. rotundata TaxID=55577 RepID=A0AB40C4J7_DIOCR|nr:uncharacterized protein LOC120271934 [Dioscorea cayenensis subsp. rotundata]
MFCLVCLLPLFLIPAVNALPLLVDFILTKVYGLFGWEYRKPERVPPACPYRPASNKNDKSVEETPQPQPQVDGVAPEGDKQE